MRWIVAAFVVGFVVGQISQDSSLKLGGYRFGIGSDGYALQNTTDWHVISQGWFPWHKRRTVLAPGDQGQVLIYDDGVPKWVTVKPDQKEPSK